MIKEKIKSYTDLIVWQKGHELVLNIYKTLSTFPKEELYGLCSQMKRAAISITSNIAEGFVRKSAKEKIQFYYISLGSVTELQNQLLIAKDLRFINDKQFQIMNIMTIDVAKLLNALIKSINNLPNY